MSRRACCRNVVVARGRASALAAGGKGHRTMPRYLVERSFPDGVTTRITSLGFIILDGANCFGGPVFRG